MLIRGVYTTSNEWFLVCPLQYKSLLSCLNYGILVYGFLVPSLCIESLSFLSFFLFQIFRSGKNFREDPVEITVGFFVIGGPYLSIGSEILSWGLDHGCLTLEILCIRFSCRDRDFDQ